jgi:hypothetical protein
MAPPQAIEKQIVLVTYDVSSSAVAFAAVNKSAPGARIAF